MKYRIGDTVMMIAHKNGNFTPAVVNADLISMKHKGVRYVSKIMAWLIDIDAKDCMLIANFMVNNPHSKQKLEEAYIVSEAKSIADEFEQSNDFKFVWSDPSWNVLNDGEHIKFYLYRTSETNMASYIFWRKTI